MPKYQIEKPNAISLITRITNTEEGDDTNGGAVISVVDSYQDEIPILELCEDGTLFLFEIGKEIASECGLQLNNKRIKVVTNIKEKCIKVVTNIKEK
jgi:hypothetical protein